MSADRINNTSSEEWNVINRIMIPVDFSEASMRGAEWGLALARQLDAEVVFLTVLDVNDLRVAMKAQLQGFETDAQLHRQVRQWVNEQFKRIGFDSEARIKRIIRRGIVEREILAAIKTYSPDLVVMGSVGIDRSFPIGGRTQAVIRKSDVPVIMIHGEPAKARRALETRRRRAERRLMSGEVRSSSSGSQSMERVETIVASR
ncbi:MAG TPA: universal stress protein [Thermoanaerobaculia bacterium]|nr:universal stress protein [Thermoanaerobaculia bacterium]